MLDYYSGKELPANAGDTVSIPGLDRSPGEGNSSLLQYSCLGNPIDRGAQWATVLGVTKSQHNQVTTQQHLDTISNGVNALKKKKTPDNVTLFKNFNI